MANILQYIIEGIDNTRAANASARAEMEKTRAKANESSRSSSQSANQTMRGFGGSIMAITKAVSYGTLIVSTFIAAFKGTTKALNWIDGLTSGMTRFKAGLDAARAAHKELQAQLEMQGKIDLENLEKANKAREDEAKGKQEYNTSVTGVQQSFSEVDAAKRNAKTEADVAAGGDEEAIRAKLQMENDLQAKNDAKDLARKEAKNKKIAEDAYNQNLEASKLEYDKKMALAKEFAQKAEDIKAQNPNMQEASPNQMEGDKRAAAWKKFTEARTAAAEYKTQAEASGYDPTGRRALTLSNETKAAENKANALQIEVDAQAQKNANAEKARLAEIKKAKDEKYLAEHRSTLQDLEYAKQDAQDKEDASKARQKFALEDQLAAARGQAAPAADALAKAKEAASVAMQAYRSPEFRRQQKDDAREQAQEEKRLQRDLERVDEKKARAEKWGGKIHLTDQEKAALGVRTTRAAEKAARAADARIGINVESLSKDMQDFLRKNTLGGNT
jgi:hypothetical protein